MVWIIFFAISCLAAIFFVPVRQWKHLWIAGIITMVLLYLIDSTFIWLGAFSYSDTVFIPGDIPTFYWISSFFGGIILAYYYPAKKKGQLPYILLSAAIFLAMELIMHWLGYFRYDKWNPIRSYILDVFGFITTLWTAQWFGAAGKVNYGIIERKT